mmetsp:Transcript_68990/g.173773  ORF Transcript_68990/g.173773 Transcript_68990/m.173773 type:complete len:145 (+) Transcript_68990:89-523(+)
MFCACCSNDEANATSEAITPQKVVEIPVEMAVEPAEELAEEKAEPKEAEEKAVEEAARFNEFVFVSDGAEKAFIFSKTPFGMCFTEAKVPVKIKKVGPGSHAEDLGIQVGMQLTKIGGENITSMSFDEVFAKVQAVSAALKEAA